MITENHIMESLSRAFIQAIAGKAGLNLKLEQNARSFDYGIDGAFHPVKKLNGKLVESGFSLEFQLKASTDWRLNNTDVIYSIKSDAYNKIVDRNNQPRAIPEILILLCLPKDSDSWIESNEDQLLLRKCCYWERLTGKLTPNKNEVTIRIPRTQHLAPSTIPHLLDKVRMGEWQ